MEYEEKHEGIIDEIKKAIFKKTKANITDNFCYSIEKRKEIFYIDLLVLISFTLILFEIKTGVKEKRARKQLAFHKKAFINSQKRCLPIKNIFFGKIKTFWVSYENKKIVNTKTNEEIEYTTFINDPLSFILKE